MVYMISLAGPGIVMTVPEQHILYEYCVPHARKQHAGRRRSRSGSRSRSRRWMSAA